MSAAERTDMVAKRTGRTKKANGRKQRPPTVSIIGAGRLGTALGLALADCGYTVEAVVARRASRARRAAATYGTSLQALTAKQLGQLPPSDLLFITTPDDVIASTATELAAIFKDERPPRRARVALHASGALSAEALRELRTAGFAVGSLHPLISISDPVAGASSLKKAFYCVEGDRRAVRLAREIVRAFGAESFSVRTEQKALYHAAAVVASGHTVALFDLASELLAQCGPSRRRAQAILLPLLHSTVENLRQREPAQALTGTFARADLSTMRRHLSALDTISTEDGLAVYIILGQRALRLARENGVSKAALKEMAQVLARVSRGGPIR